MCHPDVLVARRAGGIEGDRYAYSGLQHSDFFPEIGPMPLQLIDVGTDPDDGTGDSVRDAFEKTNRNFDALAEAIMPRLLQHAAFASLRHTHEDAVMRLVSDMPPAEVPTTLGAMWINASSGRIYLATGTSSESDWREITFVD